MKAYRKMHISDFALFLNSPLSLLCGSNTFCLWLYDNSKRKFQTNNEKDKI